MLRNPTIGNMVLATRKELELTQGGFARLIHVSASTISRWESEAQQPQLAARALIKLFHADPQGVKAILNRARQKQKDNAQTMLQKLGMA